MSDDLDPGDEALDRVGYGRPPKHTRFQKGNRANPRGRGKRERDDFAKSVEETLLSAVEIREGGRKRRVTRGEANILNLFQKAKHGDAAAADRLLTLHELSSKAGDGGPRVIEVHNALPDESGGYHDHLILDSSGLEPRSAEREIR